MRAAGIRRSMRRVVSVQAMQATSRMVDLAYRRDRASPERAVATSIRDLARPNIAQTSGSIDVYTTASADGTFEALVG